MNEELIKKEAKYKKLFKEYQILEVVFFVFIIFGICMGVPFVIMSWLDLFNVSYSMEFEKISFILGYCEFCLLLCAFIVEIVVLPQRDKKIFALRREIIEMKFGKSWDEYIQELLKSNGQIENEN